MTSPNDALYLSLLELLNEAAQDQHEPQVVNARLRELRTASSSKIDLFWEQDSYSRAYHYNALVRSQGSPALTLSASPDNGLPWLIRGTFRWNETVLVRVNNQRVRMFEAITRCDSLWGATSIAQRVVNGALLADYVEREGGKEFEISADELQAAVDALRIRQGLFTEEATRQWMRTRGISHETLERMAEELAFGAKVRNHVTSGREESYFREHLADFERAAILEVRTKTREDAQRLQRLSTENPEGLTSQLAAHGVSCIASPGLAEYAQPRIRTIWRSPCDDSLQTIFTDDSVRWLTAIEDAKGYAVVQVLQRWPADFDDVTRLEVQRRLFDAWLDEQRREAHIEWSWEQGTQRPS